MTDGELLVAAEARFFEGISAEEGRKMLADGIDAAIRAAVLQERKVCAELIRRGTIGMETGLVVPRELELNSPAAAAELVNRRAADLCEAMATAILIPR